MKKAILEEAKSQGVTLSPRDLMAKAKGIRASRELKNTITALEQGGSEVRYIVGDVADATFVSMTCDEIRGVWGAITVVVHGAGVIFDKLIAEKTDEAFHKVFDTKVKGARALLQSVADDPVKFIGFFSSVAGRCGNIGQADYAMANEVLNKVAQWEQARRGSSCTVRSFGWGPWQGGMVDAGLAKQFAARGIPLIPLDGGSAVFKGESASTGGVELVVGQNPAMASGWTRRQGEEVVTSMEILINDRSHPYLASHSIGGIPVVPVVLVLEWFSRLAGAHSPDMYVGGIENIKVLGGIVLGEFNGAGDLLKLECVESKSEKGKLSLRLTSKEGAPHYSAEIQMLAEKPEQTFEKEDNLPGKVEGASVYGNVLFHGRDFQVIRTLGAISEKGVKATLSGVKEASWPDEGWHTDVAAFDGGLQLALLWTDHMLGGASLPTSIGRFKLSDEPVAGGKVRCILHGQKATGSRAVANMVFVDENQKVVAEFWDVETHLLPKTKAKAAEETT